MTNLININVSGGSAAIGSASQGNKNTIGVNASVSSSVVERQYGAARAVISTLAGELQTSTTELDAALAQLQALKLQTTQQSPNTEDGKSVLKIVRENFSWAYPAIKDFAKVAWPALLAAIGT